MREKQVYDLTLGDLAYSGIWVFPMDDSVEDELTVRPLSETESSVDSQIIVRAHFTGRDGSHYLGYLYWDGDESVEYLKPVILLDDSTAVSFWNGIMKPSWDEYPEQAKAVRSALPLTYTSEAFSKLPAIAGTLTGLAYLDDEKIVWIK
ncbi:hypothetical protein V2K77_10805 [Pseudomonas alliivorans]|nr:hypothetical protein [Pseudomonas alliivorans]MEE4690568.1 hypothetical protein [Pseudomonas alliivorans]MEE4712369.1 hypothetical protein [Pseudomonas alliivorans]MEE4727589.1 hypothetical protein [Pseudomonas alliivorans]MEE4767537.1 hypothetical protein [Pseudomonas alliivorans]